MIKIFKGLSILIAASGIFAITGFGIVVLVGVSWIRFGSSLQEVILPITGGVAVGFLGLLSIFAATAFLRTPDRANVEPIPYLVGVYVFLGTIGIDAFVLHTGAIISLIAVPTSFLLYRYLIRLSRRHFE